MNVHDLYARSGYSDTRSLDLLQAAVRVAKPRAIAETGTYHGASAAAMALAAPEATVYTIDNGSFGVTKEEVEANMRALDVPYVVVIRGESSSLGERLYEISERVDLAFIDADHRYGAARADYESLHPLMHERSVLILDDVNLPPPDGVGQLLEEIKDDFEDWFVLPFHRGIAVLGPFETLRLILEEIQP